MQNPPDAARIHGVTTIFETLNNSKLKKWSDASLSLPPVFHGVGNATLQRVHPTRGQAAHLANEEYDAGVHVRIKRRRTPIHTDYFHSGGATTLSFIVKRANAVGSFVMRLYDECTRSNAPSVSQDFVNFVTARAILFTDHKISSLPKRTKYRHFRTIL